tara:strand:- start:909 stop:1130 length:222 start_codon:yes stop_codon:yes gene_type:complete
MASWTNPRLPYGRRKYAYRLANSGVLRLMRERQGKLHWQLTREGKFLVEDDPEFKELLEKGLVKEFWQKYNRY